VQVADSLHTNGSLNGLVIVTGDYYIDGPAATALAGALDYALLFVNPNTIYDTGVDALIRAEVVNDIIIVGGVDSVTTRVEDEINALHYSTHGSYPTITRVQGSTRVQTAEQVATFGSGHWSDTAVVAYGYNFPDSLSIAPYAAFKKAPLFLTDAEGNLSQPTLDLLCSGEFSDVLIIGLTAAVNTTTQSTLATYFQNEHVRRLGGITRYETSLECAEYALANGMLIEGIGFASGESFPDGLTSGAMQARTGAVTVLLSDAAAGVVQSWLTNYVGMTSSVTWFGGITALSDNARQVCRYVLDSSVPVTIIPVLGVHDISDLRVQVGDADYVFVGLVQSVVGTEYQGDPAIVYTNYRVTVLDNIKGSLVFDTIPLQKFGGITQDGSRCLIPENDYQPSQNLLCVFFAYAQPDGSLTVTGYRSNVSLGTVFLGSGSGVPISLNLQNSEVYQRIKTAYQNQVVTNRERFISLYDINR